jgi:hypothetical protein
MSASIDPITRNYNLSYVDILLSINWNFDMQYGILVNHCEWYCLIQMLSIMTTLVFLAFIAIITRYQISDVLINTVIYFYFKNCALINSIYFQFLK